MELSVQSKFKSPSILARRKEMIEKEKLHIKEKISYDTFLNLYNKYGDGLEDVDFAYAFLDIEDLAFRNLRRGRTSESIILAKEYVYDEELVEIRNKIVNMYNFQTGNMITKNQLMEIYDSIAGRISFRMLAEEILGIPAARAKKLTRGGVQETAVNMDIAAGKYCILHKKEKDIPDYYEINFIKKLREKIIREEKLYLGNTISPERFAQIHEKYCPEMPESSFGQEMLGLKASMISSLNSKNKVEQNILEDIDVPEEYIRSVQDKIIIRYKPEPGEPMKYLLMKELYKELGDIFTERRFIQTIFEINDDNYKHMERGRIEGTGVFKSRSVNYEALRNRIIKENKLHYDDMIMYPQFEELHQKYAPNMPEKKFAEEMLDIPHNMLQHIKYNGGRARILLGERIPTKKEFEKLQKEVIQKENLHMEDKIGHKEFKRLHLEYGGVISAEMFATEVLAMTKDAYNRIRNPLDKDGKENKRKALILTQLKISQQYIDELKELIMKKHNLEEPRKVTLEEINELYSLYGGIMSYVMFHKTILGVSAPTMSNLRCKKLDGTMVRIRKKMSREEVKTLKTYLAQDLTKREIAQRMDIRISFLQASIKELSGELTSASILYEKVKLLKTSGKSSKDISEILGISYEETRDLLTQYRIERDNENEEERLRKRRERESKKESEKIEKIEKKAMKILEEYEVSNDNIRDVRKYIMSCQERFEKGCEPFTEEELLFLAECMEFVVCNCQELGLFVKICIAQQKYQQASNFIAENIDNEEITKAEKNIFRALQKDINYAMKKEEACHLLEGGIGDAKIVSERTGVLETDVIRLKRSIDERKMFIVPFPKKTEEDFIGI